MTSLFWRLESHLLNRCVFSGKIGLSQTLQHLPTNLIPELDCFLPLCSSWKAGREDSHLHPAPPWEPGAPAEDIACPLYNHRYHRQLFPAGKDKGTRLEGQQAGHSLQGSLGKKEGPQASFCESIYRGKRFGTKTIWMKSLLKPA